MIVDRNLRILAVIVVGLLVAFLVGLLLISGNRPAPAPRAPAVPAPAPPPETPPAAPAPAPAAPDAESAEAPPPEADADPDPPGSTVVSGTAVLEDGTPLDGIVFLEAAPEEDGEWDVDLAADVPVNHASGDGAFRLRWKESRKEVVLLVAGRTAECVAAEGAEILFLHDRGEVLRFTPGVPARLVFRPLPGSPVRILLDSPDRTYAGRMRMPSFRVLDPEGRPVAGSGGALRLENFYADAERSGAAVVLELPVLPRSGRAAGDRRVVEFTVPLFERVRVPVVELMDGMRLPLVPKRPSVTGFLAPAPSADFPSGVSISAGPVAGDPIDRLLDADGAFRFFDVPEGEWVVHAMRGTADGMRWGRRTFRKGTEPVDLGPIETEGYAGLRMRVLDEEGRPVVAAGFAVTPAAGRGGGDLGVFHTFERPGPRGGEIILGNGSVWIQAAEEGHDPEGWYEIGDLEPGILYRVRDSGSPNHLSAEVTTPAENGAWAEVELRRKAGAPPASDGEEQK